MADKVVEKKPDVSIVTVAGKKKRFERVSRDNGALTKGLLYVDVFIKDITGKVVETQLFRFDVWDTSKFEEIEKIPNGSMIRVSSKPSNYNYKVDGENKYSYDLTLVDICPYSGKCFAEFAFRGRMVSDCELGTAPGVPYLVFKIASNTGKKPVFIHLRHYGYSCNANAFGYKGNAISAEGYVKRRSEDGTYQFFATSIWSNNPEDTYETEPELEEN